jgi:predicted nucleic acid-binding protein
VIVLDANALIALLGPSDPLHRRAVDGFKRIGPARYRISPLTHAKVLVGPTRAGTLERTRTAITALGVEELEPPADAAARLAGLRATTSLKLGDCCVILAAQQTSGAILTFDDRLAATAQELAIEVSLHLTALSS